VWRFLREPATERGLGRIVEANDREMAKDRAAMPAAGTACPIAAVECGRPALPMPSTAIMVAVKAALLAQWARRAWAASISFMRPRRSDVGGCLVRRTQVISSVR
jgi:hypothetical protein